MIRIMQSTACMKVEGMDLKDDHIDEEKEEEGDLSLIPLRWGWN